MKETDKRRTPNGTQSKRSAKTEKRDRKPQQMLTGKQTEFKTLHAKPDSGILVSDSNTGSEHSEVYENLVIDYVDDNGKANNNENSDNLSSDIEKEPKQGKEDESDTDTVKDSVSSHGDSLMADDEKVERVPRVPKSVNNKKPVDNSRKPRVKSDTCAGKNLPKVVNGTPKKGVKPSKGAPRVPSQDSLDKNLKDMKVPKKPSSDSSDGADDKLVEGVKETDLLDEASNSTQSTASDTETADAEENGEHEDNAALNQKIEEMEMKIERLEEELREVAALEISLYSAVPEHGSSAHKVHTPARRLSRLYIHACKHWTQDRRATIAKNTVSGLVLVSKSCGNDVPRLSFWLSNTIVLREIIAEAFGIEHQSSPLTRFAETNGKRGSGSKHVNGFLQFANDWQETGTYLTALENVESWIFCRIVESVWWQAMTPHMQSPIKALSSNKSFGKLLGPALGDQQQGSFSINLWKNAFRDASQRLCPVRTGGHDCGCLPIIARLVMEQCVARLDVAMFNAILRESALEIPTDPVSDPIVDSRVLPIPAGDLSFGSGAQLKNSVGTWSRLLTDMFGLDADDLLEEDSHSSNDESKVFRLLNELSDLLMLPKDMLMDRTIRKEVCPSIDLSIVKRILCNFTPDEFCPESVPGDVLEALNAESLVERKFLGESTRSFPYKAAEVVYKPPSSVDVAEKVAEAGARSQLSRNASVIQRKGYTSDEELQELDFPLVSIIEKSQSSTSGLPNGHSKHSEHFSPKLANERYKLLREVWSEGL